jgi:hypothetical protein
VVVVVVESWRRFFFFSGLARQEILILFMGGILTQAGEE